MTSEVLSKAGFSRRIGRSKATVSRYCHLGMPLTADGRVDVAAARAWIDANIDESYAPITPNDGRRPLTRDGIEIPEALEFLERIRNPFD